MGSLAKRSDYDGRRPTNERLVKALGCSMKFRTAAGPIGRWLLRIAVVRELLDVVDEAIEHPLAIHFRSAA